jgi:hypothetical protein
MIVIAVCVLAACKDQGPPGPNLVIQNDGTSAAQLFLVTANAQDDTVTRAVDTVFTTSVAAGAKVCETLDLSRLPSGPADPGALVMAVGVVGADTIVSSAFWLADVNNWSERLIVRDGANVGDPPELIQTRRQRTCS